MKCLHLSVLLLFPISLLAMETAPKPKNLRPNLLATLPNNGPVLVSCYSYNGNFLATGGESNIQGRDTFLNIWKCNDFSNPCATLPTQNPITTLAANPIKQELASCGPTTTPNIYLWDIETGSNITLNTIEPAVIPTIQYSNDGSRLLTGNQGGACQIWDLKSQTCTTTLATQGCIIWDAKWSPDTNQIAACSSDNIVRIWDIRTGKIIHSIEPQALTNKIAYNGAGTQLLTSAGDHVFINNPRTAALLAKYTVYGKKIEATQPALASKDSSKNSARGIQFVPGNDALWIAALDNGDLTICDLENENNTLHFKSATTLQTIAISPSAQTMAAGSMSDKETKVWDLEEFMKERKAKLQPAGWSCKVQ